MKHQNKQLVTIGIPFYNASLYLRDSVQSVINQSYTNWELILLDDGSTDDSLEIAKEFEDERITILSDGENRGLIYRLNQLTALANGEFYARMDADDIMHYNRIKVQVNFLNKHPNVDIVGSNYYLINTKNELIGKVSVNIKPDSIKSILKSGCFAHPSILGRTNWFNRNPYNKMWNRMEDFELWIRTVQYSTFKNIPEPLLFYRSIGTPTLRKYIKSNIGIIQLLQKRTEYKIHTIDSIYYSFLYLLKILIYIGFYLFGQMSHLIKKRSKKLIPNEVATATEILLRSIKI